ncbi:DUF2157 domain-containing protein [Desertivirga arenae]|uniref:DUF2157 domain-containing protein n=1 Tax=Desertivirga arenae TaxID=2810309 RepID=UPI001A95D25A
MAKLNLDKQEADFLNQTIHHWKTEGLLDETTSNNLLQSYEVKQFDWRRLAQYSIWIALACGLIAFASLVIDDAILDLIAKLSDTPDIIISIISAVLATYFYFIGQKRKNSNPERVFSNEAILFIGVLFTASAIAFLGKVIDNGKGHFSLLFLLSVFIYGILALRFSSQLIWAFALFSLGSWFGTETGYQTHWGDYFLRMNYPLRFVFFGVFLSALAILMARIPRFTLFKNITYVIGLFYLFVSLWLLSIFGNFGNMEDWLKVKQKELLYWGLLSALFSLGIMFYGLKKNDSIAREFGISFLLINIYTRYFEYFWDITNKALFFSILALSFWLIGSRAERIWNLKGAKKSETAKLNDS